MLTLLNKFGKLTMAKRKIFPPGGTVIRNTEEKEFIIPVSLIANKITMEYEITDESRKNLSDLLCQLDLREKAFAALRDGEDLYTWMHK